MASHHPPALGARFHVEEVLMDGPFERAYRARDAVLHRDVLLKLPAREAFDGWTVPVKERLLREARALARIRHPNIAPIHHVEETAEGPLLVLDLPRGETLAERLQNGPLPVDETVVIARQLADALAHVHQQSVVHRAVGPSTVRILANGTVELGSFTFAKEFGGARGTSLVNLRGAAAQTAARAQHLPEYPAPEQLAGHTADPRADVFALGCTMFRCLAGRDAFPPGTEHAQAPDLRTLRKDVGRPLAEVVRKCLAFAKSARYATAREVVDALQALHVSKDQGAFTLRAYRVLVGAAAAVGIAAIAVVVSLNGNAATRSAEAMTVSPVVAPKSSYPARYDDLHGLFVGIGKAYAGSSLGALRNPVREIEEVGNFLIANDDQWKRPGAIQRLPDEQATFAAIDAQLVRLETEAGENDAVLIWFAGHGVAVGEYDFAMVAADAQGDIHNGTGFLRRARLLRFLEQCRAKHVLVVLDCCHAGAVSPLLRGRDPEAPTTPTVLARHLEGWSREILCSCGSEQQARDGTRLSPFCETLLAALREEAGKGQDHYATKYLAPEVAKRLAAIGLDQRLQEPRLVINGQQSGSFVFRLRP